MAVKAIDTKKIKDKKEKRVDSEIMTVDEVAEYLKLSKITIYKLAKKGELPAFRIGNSWRFHRAKIEELIKK